MVLHKKWIILSALITVQPAEAAKLVQTGSYEVGFGFNAQPVVNTKFLPFDSTLGTLRAVRLVARGTATATVSWMGVGFDGPGKGYAYGAYFEGMDAAIFADLRSGEPDQITNYIQVSAIEPSVRFSFGGLAKEGTKGEISAFVSYTRSTIIKKKEDIIAFQGNSILTTYVWNGFGGFAEGLCSPCFSDFFASGYSIGNLQLQYLYVEPRSFVPDPNSWVTMIVGFCLVGTKLRRQRRAFTRSSRWSSSMAR